MAMKDDELIQIIDDIEAGLIDDPMEDYKYLNMEAEKYRNHELSGEIFEAVGKIMYEDIPAMARKNLKDDLTGDANAYNMLINEANKLMLQSQWGSALLILENLIGKGIGFKDYDNAEFRTIQDEAQSIFYRAFFKKENNKVVILPVDLGKLYGLYGCALVEFRQFEAAEEVLEISLHFNPLDFRFFFEYAESIKAQGKFDIYESLSRKYLGYVYRAVDIGHLYRNLGYAYIEKKDYETAVILYYYSKVYDPDAQIADHELSYIGELTGRKVKEPSNEEADAVMKRENIQLGVSDQVLKKLYGNAYAESHVNHDVEKTEYFCRMIYDVTREQKYIDELMEVAKDPSKGFTGMFGIGEEKQEPVVQKTVYEIRQEESLKEVFPEFPQIRDCRLRITFTLGSVKYKDTVYQILTHIDEMSKLVENKDVTVYFTDLQSVTTHIKYINDLIVIASGWKSFRMTINDISRDKYEFRYFTDYLKDKLEAEVPRSGTAEEILKEYKKEAAPKRAKKRKPEDGYQVNVEGCTPQEIVTGIANTYAQVYLGDFDVKVIHVSDDEILLCANDDFVVDIWVSPYGYGATMDGIPDGYAPYEYCTYIIQELSRNNLFKYNASAFRRIFTGASLCIESLRFNGPDCYSPAVNHFYKMDAAYPELRLKAKYDEFGGDPYIFIVFEMENSDGSKGTAIGFTDKKPRTLLVKVCKELETKTPFDLEGNSANGLVGSISKSFIKAFLSWKGERKTKRLEKHLTYYFIEKVMKEKNDGIDVAKEIMKDVEAGKYDGVERKSYADIGRK